MVKIGDLLKDALGGDDDPLGHERRACEKLASAGKDMDGELRKAVRRTVDLVRPENYFAALVVHGFTWSDHAKDKDSWWDISVDYLVSGNVEGLERISECCGRFGVERCEEALRSWKDLYDEFALQFRRKMNGSEVLATQEALNARAVDLHKKGVLPGIGCWLLCAPFKMLLLDQEHLYDDPVIDGVLPPLGLEVMRGVRKCMKASYKFADRLAPSDIVNEDGGAIDADGLGTVALVHDLERRVAEIAGCRALPVNSGLWLLGNGDLVL